jgi:RNA polymerase sigma-70 factor (ECF subfamily)
MYAVSKGEPLPPEPEPPPDARRRRFEELYSANQAPVLGYLLRRTENTDDAADALAETFLAAWRRLDDVPAGPGARLWLYCTARRVLANHRRGERRRLALADRLRADLTASFQPAEYSGQLAEIAAVFRRLPAADRELLALAGWEGLDPSQIAAVLGCSRNAARIRLHRARRRFAAALAQAEVAAGPAHARVTNGGLA